jgi:hypothetical protein
MALNRVLVAQEAALMEAQSERDGEILAQLQQAAEAVQQDFRDLEREEEELLAAADARLEDQQQQREQHD